MEAIAAPLLIKHELVSGSSVMQGLIFDGAPRFFFSSFLFSSPLHGPFHLFKRRDVIGRTAVTMAHGFPGARSAVALILSGRGREGGERTARAANGRRCEAPQCFGFLFFFPGVQERSACFLLVRQAHPRGTLACVYNICLTFWS